MSARVLAGWDSSAWSSCHSVVFFGNGFPTVWLSSTDGGRESERGTLRGRHSGSHHGVRDLAAGSIASVVSPPQRTALAPQVLAGSGLGNGFPTVWLSGTEDGRESKRGTLRGRHRGSYHGVRDPAFGSIASVVSPPRRSALAPQILARRRMSNGENVTGFPCRHRHVRGPRPAHGAAEDVFHLAV
jgi:hypothetical protein